MITMNNWKSTAGLVTVLTLSVATAALAHGPARAASESHTPLRVPPDC